MVKFLTNIKSKIGRSPGTLIYTGIVPPTPTEIRFIKYNIDELEISDDVNPKELKSKIDEHKINWVNVDGMQDLSIIESIGNMFGIHYLTLEDMLNTNQLPKFEQFGEYIYFSFKNLVYDKQANEITHEHLNLILKENVILSFREQRGDIFGEIRPRLKRESSRSRERGADFLYYVLIDTVIDNYYLTIEELTDKINEIELELLENPTKKTYEKITHHKRSLVMIRKAIYPLKEALRKLSSAESPLIDPNTQRFFNDVNDHLHNVIENIEIMRELLNSYNDTYMSILSNRANSIMMTLTIIATIFIPLTFIAGVYGMNFKYMPELEWKYGYFIIMGLMFMMGISMYIYMKRKKWF